MGTVHSQPRRGWGRNLAAQTPFPQQTTKSAKIPLLSRKLTCPLNNLLAQRFYKFRRCCGKETFAHLKEKLGRQKAIKRIVCACILSALKVALWHYTKELFLTFPSLIYTWNDLYYLYTSFSFPWKKPTRTSKSLFLSRKPECLLVCN